MNDDESLVYRDNTCSTLRGTTSEETFYERCYFAIIISALLLLAVVLVVLQIWCVSRCARENVEMVSTLGFVAWIIIAVVVVGSIHLCMTRQRSRIRSESDANL
jgi:heme/copper-type cytochrome/quinol oxidase subunit 4